MVMNPPNGKFGAHPGSTGDDGWRRVTGATPALGEALDHVARLLRASTVQITVAGGSGGAGVVWSANGGIITNAHVARRDTVTVTTPDGRALHGRVERRDARRDLALLRVNAQDLVPAAPGDDSALRPGQLVLACGHPLGWTNALAVGVVHRVEAGEPPGHARWIHADVRLAPGNSGGPLANAAGRVVGINTMVAWGLGLAIPVSAVQRFLQGAPPLRRSALVPAGMRLSRNARTPRTGGERAR